MNVLFVYSREVPQSPDKPLVDFETLQFGISIISSLLKTHNHLTRLLVLTRSTEKTLITEIYDEFKPDIVCFTAVASEYVFIEQTAQYIRVHNPNAYLLIGGPHVSLAPNDQMLETFDALCVGEGEYPTLELLQQLEKKKSPGGIPNLWIRLANGAIEKNGTRPFIQNLDILPFPDRTMWDEWIDFRVSTKRPSLLLGRGCPFQCTYCCNHAMKDLGEGKYVRERSPGNIIGEIKSILEEYPSTAEIYFEVETFATNLKWCFELCDRLTQFNNELENPLNYGVNIRITPKLSKNCRDFFLKLKEANFRFINIGLESGSENIRRNVLKRNYSNEDLYKVVNTAKELGLDVVFFNLIGIPDETREDLQETIALNRRCQPDGNYLSIFYPYPGTRLHTLCEEKGYLPENLLGNEKERVKAIMNYPDLSSDQIQKAFIWFDYYVYKDYKPVEWLAESVLDKYRLVYHSKSELMLPFYMVKDILSPPLFFGEGYKERAVLTNLLINRLKLLGKGKSC